MINKVLAMNIAPPPIKSPDQFHSIVVQDLQVWKKIVTDASISGEN